MAKKVKTLVKFVSSANTGYYYIGNKNPRTTTEKMVLRKYDPVVRKHVNFNEAKMK
jgi:large subunit ribosomal protein L33